MQSIFIQATFSTSNLQSDFMLTFILYHYMIKSECSLKNFQNIVFTFGLRKRLVISFNTETTHFFTSCYLFRDVVDLKRIFGLKIKYSTRPIPYDDCKTRIKVTLKISNSNISHTVLKITKDVKQ